MLETEKAYIAGLLDADGCICIKKTKIYEKSGQIHPNLSLEVVITNMDTKMLDWIKKKNPNTCTGKVRKNGNCYRLALPSKKAIDFLCGLVPYLFQKQAQALLAIDFQEQKRNGNSSDEYYLKQLEFYTKMHNLNHRFR